MAGTTITLGGEQIAVGELPFLANRKWCERALPILEADQGIVARESGADRFNSYLDMQMQHGEAMFGLVLDFLPAQKRDELAERATGSEVLQAFFALVQVAFSTGFFLGLYGGISMNGSNPPPTGTNSVEPNGESGQTS
jgi:hypothetical protein